MPARLLASCCSCRCGATGAVLQALTQCCAQPNPAQAPPRAPTRSAQTPAPYTTNEDIYLCYQGGILLACYTQHNTAKPIAGSGRHCLTTRTRHSALYRRCRAPRPKSSRVVHTVCHTVRNHCVCRILQTACSGGQHTSCSSTTARTVATPINARAEAICI